MNMAANTANTSIRTLSCPGGKVAFTVHGEGAAVLLIHGLGDTVATWKALTPMLVDAGHQVIELHLRGCGASDATFDAYDAVSIGKDALAVLDLLGVSKVSVVGCSMGGAVAAWMAAESPDRVTSLVFLNAFVRDMDADWWMKPMLGWLLVDLWGAWMWKQYWKTLLPTGPADLEERAEALRLHLCEPGRLAALRGQIAASKQPVAERLADVAAPTLIVMGEKDPDFADPAEEGRLQAELLGGEAVVAVIAAVGHYPQVEATEQTFNAMVGFWRELGARNAS